MKKRAAWIMLKGILTPTVDPGAATLLAGACNQSNRRSLSKHALKLV